MIRPFLIALQFLTRLPVRTREAPTPRLVGRSLLYYPLVGLLLGLLLAAAAWSTSGWPATLHAAVLLALWVVSTGALHLDGLADSADAWVGGAGSREKTLVIMKDPGCGPMGAVSLVLLLLVKFAALEQVLAGSGPGALMVIPLLGRTVPPLLFLTTPYLRRHGLGEALSAYAPRGIWIGTLLAAVVALLLGGAPATSMIGATVITFAVVRTAALRRLGGITGDIAGAAVEITETTVIVALALAV